MAFYQEVRSCTLPTSRVKWLGDGVCNDEKYNTADCGFDDGDCLKVVEQQPFYPDCSVEEYWKIGNGYCNGGEYNTKECGSDGGDCKFFNINFPGCTVQDPWRIGDGQCDGDEYNTEKCGWDGYDCGVKDAFPNCDVDNPSAIGDGYCDGRHSPYNTKECDYDGGDCTTTTIFFINGKRVEPGTYRRDTRTYANIQTVTSLISLISSMAIIWIIWRSSQKLSVPFHRLLLGLCIADIISSFALSFSTLPIPSELRENTWKASGNNATCQAQGFVIFFGSMVAPLYTCSLCIYYLIVVTYRKGRNADRYIRGKIELYLHGLPIFVPLLGAIGILSLNAFHPNMTYCFIGPDPSCGDFGKEDCESSYQKARILFYVFSVGPYLILPCVIFTTMLMMYRAVLGQEKKLQQFGVGALKIRSQIRSNDCASNVSSTDEYSNAQRSSIRKESKMNLNVPRRGSSMMIKSKSNSTRNLSRAIMARALSYSVAYFCTYLFSIIISILTLSGVEDVGPALNILARIFFPLQGFFNFFVFIFPRVLDVKNTSRLSWNKAFLKAVRSTDQRSYNIRRSVELRSAVNRKSILKKKQWPPDAAKIIHEIIPSGDSFASREHKPEGDCEEQKGEGVIAGISGDKREGGTADASSDVSPRRALSLSE